MRLMIAGFFCSRSDFLDVGSGESLAQSYAIGLTLLALAIGAVATLAVVAVHCRSRSTAVYGIRGFQRQ